MNNFRVRWLTLLLCFILFSSFTSIAQSTEIDMTNERMENILKITVDSLKGISGNWQVHYAGLTLFIVTDKRANRMRIFTPVVDEKDLQTGQMKKMLEANFHSALDAKYSLFQEYVISVFTHPLKELREEQFIDALQQTVVLAKTFGTSYSSTDLIFSPGLEQSKPKMKQN